MANERHKEFVGKYFKWDHLPFELRDMSQEFEELAHTVMSKNTKDDDELMVALRKLLEAKDCAVRSMLPLDD
jgi:hypothetical protein